MNQDELEARLMSGDETTLIKGLRAMIKSELSTQDLDINRKASDAINTALDRYVFVDVVETAIIDLIHTGMLDRNIWIRYRRPVWWRRWWREVITFITFKSSSTTPFIG